MKKIQFSMILISILVIVSCSHNEQNKQSTNSTITLPVPYSTPDEKVTEVKKIEIKNFDEEFQNSLKNVWGTYFIENYNESRSLDIYIVTNRNEKNQKFGCTNNDFGISTAQNNKLSYGVCRINVPKNHSSGEIEFSTEKNASSHKYYKIVNSKEIDEKHLIDFITRSKRTPLIFIHGFNVKYQDAILRASQITYDLKYQGPVILFTWPSGAGDGFLDDKLLTKTYELNKKSAVDSINHIKNLISNLYEHEIPINIIVHSMGHQVLLPALRELGVSMSKYPNLVEKKLINELILNAPDYEILEFKKQLQEIKATSKRITLYCSENDKAMVVSTSINKNSRLGACANLEGIDSINVGLVDNQTFGVGHSYYASRDIITDVFQVLLGLDAEKRLFIKKSEPNSSEKYYLRN
jgi:esterase/lipase superfamily enzyme